MKRIRTIAAYILIAALLLSTMSSALAADAGSWRMSGGRWWYEFRNGGYACSQWLQYKNDWYYFDSEGWMVTGWRKVDGRNYYFCSSGAMATGWQKISNNWYYFGSNGGMHTGWLFYNQKWYFLNADGTMATGWLHDKGVKYYLNNDGDMVTGWKQINGYWYYFNTSGGMVTGWVQDGAWYYLDRTGKMATGWVEYKNNWYYMKSSGAMATGSMTIDGVHYNFGSSGEASPSPASISKPLIVDEVIPFSTEYQDDYSRFTEEGNKTIRTGVNGSKTVTYMVTYSFGTETSRTIIEEYVTQAAVNEIISVPKKQHVSETREETKTETIPFATETRKDSSRLKGEPDQIIQEGKDGVKTYVYTVTYKDGVETDRQLKSDSITTQPVNKIVSVAVGENTVTYVTETVDIPFETVYQDAPNWLEGEEEVVTEGRDGQKEIIYAVTKDPNGNEISRVVSSEKITRNVTNRVIYRGTFVPVITYKTVSVPDLPECDASRRDSTLDAACSKWAMKMAKENRIFHSDLGYGESVGGWGSIDSMVYGRNYTVISTQDGQTYNYTVSLGSHGGEGLATGSKWGAGAVKRTETLPDGSTVSVFFACARSEQ